MYIILVSALIAFLMLDIKEVVTLSTLFDPRGLAIILFGMIVYSLGLRCMDDLIRGYQYFINSSRSIEHMKRVKIEKSFDGLGIFTLSISGLLALIRWLIMGGSPGGAPVLLPILYGGLLTLLLVYPIKKKLQLGGYMVVEKGKMSLPNPAKEVKSNKEAFLQAIKEQGGLEGLE